MAISIRSVICPMRECSNAVEEVAYALREQDSFSLPEIISRMSAKEILELEYDSGTVLSTLIEALFSSTEETNFFLEKTWERVCKGVCDSFVASAAIESGSFMEGVRRTVQHLMSTSSEHDAGVQAQSKSDCGGVSQEVILLVSKGIKIIAQKLEEARLEAERGGPTEHTEFCDIVAKYLQRDNVTYVFSGVEYKRNCIHAVALQYLFHAGDPLKQEVLLEPVKELLLGFFRYSLDSNDARSLHYALSLSGGVHEDLFIERVLKPLFNNVYGTFGKNLAVTAEDTIDNKGNTLLHYALSSVCCSEKTISMVIEKLGVRGLDVLGKDDLSLVEILVNNVPYYAMFFSLGDMCRVKERSLALSSVNNDLKKATDESNFSAMRHALSKRTSELYKMHIKAHEAYGHFGSILKLLCREDEKVRKAEECATLYDDDKRWDFKIPGILSEYKALLQQVLNMSDAFTDEKDQLLVKHLGIVFNTCDSRSKLIGARSAASEVVRAVLQDRRYIRRFGVTVACSREYEAVGSVGERTEENTEKLSSGWVYDPHSWGVNRFFGMMCIMCKWSALAFEDFCALHDMTREAMLVYRSEKEMFSKIIKGSLAALWILSFAALIGGAACIWYGCEKKVLYAVNAIVSLLAVGLATAIILCNRELIESERNIKTLQDSFADYVNMFWSQRAAESIMRANQTPVDCDENAERFAMGEKVVVGDGKMTASDEVPETHLSLNMDSAEEIGTMSKSMS